MAAPTKEEYQLCVQNVRLVASLLAEYRIADILAAIDRAETTGPLLDPTLWREKNQAMSEDKESLEAALPLWRHGQFLKTRAEA